MPQRGHMAKHLRKTKVRTYRNRLRKNAMKSTIREVMDAARDGDADTVAAGLPEAQKAIDKAAKHGVIHKHTASRRIARLVARTNAMLAEG